MWGSGMYGGTNTQCPYKMDVGDEATSIADDIADANDKMKEIQNDLADAKKDLREKTTSLKKAQDDFSRKGFDKNSSVYSTVDNHLQGGVTCSEEKKTVTTFTAQDWADICNTDNDELNPHELCGRKNVGGTSSEYNLNGCASALKDWQKNEKGFLRAKAKVDQLTSDLKDQKAVVAGLKGDYKRAVRNHLEEQKSDGAGGCYECMLAGNGNGNTNSGPSTTQTALGVGADVVMGLGSMYMGNQNYKTISNNNASLGYPTAPVSSFGYGYPYFSGALYGATSGGGSASGSFGCSSSGNAGGNYAGNGMNSMNGGAFGYPSNMSQSPMSGGMYLPGSNSWGSNGPWGLSGNANSMNGMTNPYAMNNGNNMYGMMNQNQNPYANAYGSMNPYSNYGGTNSMYNNPYSYSNPYSSPGNYGSSGGYGNYGGYGNSGNSSELYQLMLQFQMMQSGSLYGNNYGGGYGSYGGYGYPYRSYTNTNTLPGVYSPSYLNYSNSSTTSSSVPSIR